MCEILFCQDYSMKRMVNQAIDAAPRNSAQEWGAGALQFISD
jgi:hypothetical protein